MLGIEWLLLDGIFSISRFLTVCLPFLMLSIAHFSTHLIKSDAVEYSTVYISVFLVFDCRIVGVESKISKRERHKTLRSLRNRLLDNGSGVSSDILSGCSSIMEIDIAGVGITNFWSF